MRIESVTQRKPRRAGARGGWRRRTGLLAAGLVAAVLAVARDPGGPVPSAAADDASTGQRTEKPAPSAGFGAWGVDMSGIDPAVRPGDSFYDYANGAWAAHAEIAATNAYIDVFAALRDKTQEEVVDIVARMAASGASPETDAGKVAALFLAFMDTDRIEQLGPAPIAADLAGIRNATTRTGIAILMGRSMRNFGSSLFTLEVLEDQKEPGRHTLFSAQRGLFLPNRDYYLDESFREKKAAYRDYAARLLDMAGWPDSGERADEIVAFETRIAGASWSLAESRDRDRNYNPLTPAELGALAPGFPWAAWLDAAGVGDARVIVVLQKTAFPKLARIFAETPVATLQAWQAFRVVDEAARYLPDRFSSAWFDFHARTLSGQIEPVPRWRNGVRLVGNTLGDAVSREYAARYFSPDSRQKVEELARRLKRAMRNRIENLSWMTPETKKRALEKLDLLRVRIGYPDTWRDYSSLRIDASDLVGNIRRAEAFRWDLQVAKLDRPVDPLEWNITPLTVDARYMVTRNEITLPAAILQPPFFDPNADAAVNYGAIGGIAGHEITHAFDDQGRKSDGHGLLVDWWQPADAARFQEEAAKLGAQYDAYEAAPGVHVKGSQTMGENIADLGGILLALDAWRASLGGASAPVLDGTTGEQRVFLGWSQIWRSKLRPDVLMTQVTSDFHAPERFRVDGPVRNVDAWYGAFGVKPGDRLYLKPEDRVRIW
jgi:putative endopeptidase